MVSGKLVLFHATGTANGLAAGMSIMTTKIGMKYYAHGSTKMRNIHFLFMVMCLQECPSDGHNQSFCFRYSSMGLIVLFCIESFVLVLERLLSKNFLHQDATDYHSI